METEQGSWWWQGGLMASYRRALQDRSQPELAYLERARMACFEAARLADAPPYNRRELMPSLAVQLFGEAVFSALAALQCRRDPSWNQASHPDSLEAAFENASLNLEDLLRHPEQKPQVLTLLRRILSEPHQELTERSPEAEQALRELAERIVSEADTAERGIERIWFQRVIRVFVPLLVVVTFTIGAKALADRNELVAQTSFPWKASSTHSDPGCQSPRQGCEQDHFFFHTRHDREPWIEFDLEGKSTVSQVKVLNRTDCRGCSERAVPLVIEISDDREHWTQVARRTTDFVSWTASFPRKNARWLRLRVQHHGFFHLRQVRIYP